MAYMILRNSAFVFTFVAGSLALPGASLDAREKAVSHSVKPAFGYHETRRTKERSRKPKLRIDQKTPVEIVLNSADFEDERDLTEGFLRNKMSTEPRRSVAKIIHVTDEQLEIGEARAARREKRLLENIDKIEIRYYRPNEAYDVRFPSIVYLDSIKK